MDLGLEIFQAKGRREAPLTAEFVRPLTQADLAKIDNQVDKGKREYNLKRLSQRHHALARTLAAGAPVNEAAFACGYASNTVSLLMNDPTFNNLVEFYKQEKDREYRQVHAEMANVALDLVDSIADDLEDGKLTPGQKLAALPIFLDRTGHGPATTSTHKHEHTVNIADRVGNARKRLEQRKMIDITPQEEKAEDAA